MDPGFRKVWLSIILTCPPTHADNVHIRCTTPTHGYVIPPHYGERLKKSFKASLRFVGTRLRQAMRSSETQAHNYLRRSTLTTHTAAHLHPRCQARVYAGSRSVHSQRRIGKSTEGSLLAPRTAHQMRKRAS